MKKLVMLMALFGVAISASADRQATIFIPPRVLMSGDFVTVPAAAATNDATPWFASNGVSATTVVIGDIAGSTATAVAFEFQIPDNFSKNGELYAIVEPAATDETVQLQADVVVQSSYMSTSLPAEVSTVTIGTASAVFGAGAQGEHHYLRLQNTALDNPARRARAQVYVGRSAGTGENLIIHGFQYRYKPIGDKYLPNN